SMRVRRVLNQGNVMLPTDVPDLFDLRRDDSTHVDQEDRLGIRLDLAPQILGTHLKRLPLTIDKDHLCPRVYGRGGAGNEGMAPNGNRRAFDTDGQKDELNGTGAVARSKSVFTPAILRPFTFELLNIRANTDEPAAKDFFKTSHDRPDFFIRISEIETCYSHH